MQFRDSKLYDIIFIILTGLLSCTIIGIGATIFTLIFIKFNTLIMVVVAILIIYNVGEEIINLYKKG